jgi:hypothetical protein
VYAGKVLHVIRRNDTQLYNVPRIPEVLKYNLVRTVLSYGGTSLRVIPASIWCVAVFNVVTG